jgi:hypothetical protein
MLTILVLSLLSADALAPPVIRADNEELRGYLIEAAENNPGLRAQHDEWLAALEKVPQVKSLDDPMFTYGQFIQSDVSLLKLGLAQKFPWFGTLRAKGNKALAEADAERERLYAERNRVFSEIKKAYYEYAFLAESIRVTESQIEVLTYMEDIVSSKMSLGFANEDELLRVSIEKTKTQDRRDGFLQFRPALAPGDRIPDTPSSNSEHSGSGACRQSRSARLRPSSGKPEGTDCPGKEEGIPGFHARV